MSTTTQQRPAPQTQTKTIDDAAKLLDQVIANTRGGTYKTIEKFFEDHIPQLEELLPEKMKGQGARLVKRALLTFEKAKVAKLKQCTPASFVRTVLEAAELGLAIDGYLAHAVPYNNKKKDANGCESWVIEAQLQIDYKGLLAIAKRTGQVIDGRADVVRQGDQFSHGRKNGRAFLEHTYAVDVERGAVIAAYGELILPHGRYDYTLLQTSEVERIRKKSKAGNDGPWVDWYDRMAAKSALRRALKTYCDDPQVQYAIELDEREYGTPAFDAPVVGKVHRSALNDTVAIPSAQPHSQASTAAQAPSRPSGEETPQMSTQGDSDGVDEPAHDEPNADDGLAHAKLEVESAFAECERYEAAAALMRSYEKPGFDPQLLGFAKLCFEQAKERLPEPKAAKKGKGQKSMLEDSPGETYYAEGQ